MTRIRRLLSSIAIDVGPLRRHRDFRLLFAGQIVTFLGSMVTFVALPYQAYQLTGSSLVVGLLGVVEIAPLVISALLGGALADAVDRRRMMLLTEVGFMACSGVLMTNAGLAQPRLWVLFVTAAVMATLDGLQRPSLEAMIPRLVERDELSAAAALTGLRWQFGMIAGPTLGGVLIATTGLTVTYGFDVATFTVSLAALWLMRAVPAPADAARVSLRGIAEGLRYARSRRDLLGSYAVDIMAMFFGMPIALFPAVADRFGGAGVLGLLYAAISVGALLATVTSGWTRRVHHHGRAIAYAAVCWGVAIIGFGMASSLWLALAGLAVAGAADDLSGIFRQTMWNRSIPDRLRGRMAGIEQVSYSAGPILGNVESGIASALFNVRTAIVSGGVLCVVGVGVVLLLLPELWRYDDRCDGRAA